MPSFAHGEYFAPWKLPRWLSNRRTFGLFDPVACSLFLHFPTVFLQNSVVLGDFCLFTGKKQTCSSPTWCFSLAFCPFLGEVCPSHEAWHDRGHDARTLGRRHPVCFKAGRQGATKAARKKNKKRNKKMLRSSNKPFGFDTI